MSHRRSCWAVCCPDCVVATPDNAAPYCLVVSTVLLALALLDLRPPALPVLQYVASALATHTFQRADPRRTPTRTEEDYVLDVPLVPDQGLDLRPAKLVLPDHTRCQEVDVPDVPLARLAEQDRLNAVPALPDLLPRQARTLVPDALPVLSKMRLVSRAATDVRRAATSPPLGAQHAPPVL